MHCSDYDPRKPINWKRMAALNGEYGVLGDLGMHVLHLPLRFGWYPRRLFAVLSNIMTRRPGPGGELVDCDTWDNASLLCEAEAGFPMLLEMKRIAPGEMNTWTLEIFGERGCAAYSTKQPATLRTLDYEPGGPQSWAHTDIGSRAGYPSITGEIFEFGFSDGILQMLAAFCDEVVNGAEMAGPVRCATLEETVRHHAILGAALESGKEGRVVELRPPAVHA